ncbi:hypothetical protein ABPG77_009235 [Micractinium sp. CCAP 211/92]
MNPPVCLAMSLASAGIAAFLLSARGLFKKEAIHPMDSQHTSLGRLDAAGALADAGAMAALALSRESWASAGMGSRSADLLKLGLAARGLADTVNSAWYSGTVSPLLVLPFLAATGSGFVLPACDLLAAGQAKGLMGELRRRLAPPTRSLLAGAHSLLALLLPATGGALLTFWPRFASYHMFGYSYGASAFLMATLAGGAVMSTLPAMNLLLKDAASSGRLDSWPARLLNAGQLVAALPHLAVLLPKGGGSSAGFKGWLLPAYTAAWSIALATSAAGLLAGTRASSGVGPIAAEAATKAQVGKEI